MMKRYITANISLQKGSYLLDRSGNLYSVDLHVPSTTYMSRGIQHLCPTDIDFLIENAGADKEDGVVVYWYCLYEYLHTLTPTIADRTRFDIYCELKYTNILKQYVGLGSKCPYTANELEYLIEDFEDLNEMWYTYCKDNYVKISIFGNAVEFRITSDDSFDWNKVIIDDFILKYDKGPSTIRYTILRESANGYQEYFLGATKAEILEADKVVLSSTYITRTIEGNTIKYSK